MKPLNHCSECDKKLSEEDRKMNRDAGIDAEEWICILCDNESDPT